MRFSAPGSRVLLGAIGAGLAFVPAALADPPRDKHCLSDLEPPSYKSVGSYDECPRAEAVKAKCDEAREIYERVKKDAKKSCDMEKHVVGASEECKAVSGQTGSQACEKSKNEGLRDVSGESARGKSRATEELRRANKECRDAIRSLETTLGCEGAQRALTEKNQENEDRAKDIEESGRNDQAASEKFKKAAETEDERVAKMGPVQGDSPRNGSSPGAPSPGGSAPEAPAGQGAPQQQAQNGGGQPQPAGGPSPQGGNPESTIQDKLPVAQAGNPVTGLSDRDQIKNPETKIADVGPAVAAPTAFLVSDLASLRPPASVAVPAPAAAPATEASFSPSGATREVLRARLAASLAGASALATSPAGGGGGGGDGSGSSPAGALPVFAGSRAPVPVDTTSDPGVSLGGGMRVSAAAAAESLDSFQKQLSNPQISMMGSETEAAVRKMLGDNGDAPPSPPDELEDGIGDRNGPTLFERAHTALEMSQRRGLVRGVAAYR